MFFNKKLYQKIITQKQRTKTINSDLEKIRFLEKELDNVRKKCQNIENEYEILLEQSTNGILHHNSKGEIIYANSIACQILKSSPKYLLGKKKYLGNYSVYREDFALCPPDMLPINICLNTSNEVRNQILGIRKTKDDVYIWLKINSIPLVEIGKSKPYKVLTILDDITDIFNQNTEIQREKEKVEFTKANIAAIIENTPDSIWAIDRNYTILYTNDVFRYEFFLAFGVWLKIGDRIIDKLPIEIQNGWKERYDRTLQGDYFLLEDVIKTEKGEVCIEVSMNPISNKKVIVGAAVFARNITKRKLIEDELIHAKMKAEMNEQMFRNFLDYSTTWETFRDAKRNLLYISRFFEVLTGYKTDDYIDGKIDVFSICHPDDILATKEAFDNIQKGINTVDYRFRIITKENEIKFINVNACQILSKQGEVVGYRASMADVTERVVNEEKTKLFRHAIEQSQISIIITDSRGVIEYVNPKCMEISGYSREEMLGRSAGVFKSGYTSPALYQELWDTIKAGKDWKGVFLNKKKSGDFYYEEAIISPIKNKQDKIVNYVAVKEDITHRKEIQKKILQAIMETEEKERIRFAKDLHDGIGPILSTAKMFVQCFLRENTKMNTLDIANNAIGLINDAQKAIKEISFNLSPHLLQSSGLVVAIKTFAQKIEETRGISIKITENHNRRISSNIETVLYRILCECINNTIKHAKAKTIKIFFDFSDKYLYISCADDGIGFDLSILETNINTGLYNIKSRIESIGGRIDFFTNPETGTKICLQTNI